jgi:NADPH-dependent glutamate synthase beta subunit-like oxidoreductase
VDLGLDDLHSLAVFPDNGTASGNPVLINAKHINESLQTATKAVYNLTDPEAIGHFTSHSIRVGACVVALHAAAVQFTEIKFALRWKSDSFYNYLRNLPCQSARMAAAVLNFNPDRFTLVPRNVL